MLKISAFLACTVLVVVFSAGGCRNDSVIISSPQREISAPPGTRSVSSSSGEFGFRLFSAVDRAEGNKNIFISPLSVSMALGMLLNGAHDATYDSIARTLALEGLSQREINDAYKSLIRSLASRDPSVSFRIANSVWYRNTFAVESLFVNQCKEYFQALVAPLDFNDPQAASAINSWVDRSTSGKITGIVDPPIPPEIVMYLIDAIYFKGSWTYRFDSLKTVDDSFFVPGGAAKPVRMMNQTKTYLYYQENDFQLVDLPYGSGDFRMSVLLPAPGTDVDQLILSTDRQDWDARIASLDSMPGHLALPRFKLQYELLMNDVLKSLGMAIAFDPQQANFASINPAAQLYVSKVKHKSFVEVNEEGTEAAAATSVEIGLTSVRHGEPKSFTMVVNRPFVFVIRDASSGTILFIGKIVDPSA